MNRWPQLSLARRVAAAHQDANETAVGRNKLQISGWPSGIDSVIAVVRSGLVSDSNTGHRCQSNDTIAVQLVGTFDIPTTGRPTGPGIPNDFAVREVDLSVDSTTGKACLMSVRTKPGSPDPGAVVLFSR